MIYIKKYENFYTVAEPDYLRYGDEFSEYPNRQITSVDNETIKAIDELEIEFSVISAVISDLRTTNKYIKMENEKNVFYIYQYEDEWYQVEIIRKIYKDDQDDNIIYWCDQIEGLIKCIKDEIY